MQVDSSTTQMSFAQQAFSSVSVNGKYEGLIPKTPLKMIRNNIYQLMSYIDSAVPQFAPLHLVVSVIRILQIVGPSFCANYQDFWQPGIPKNAIGIISIFFHLIPNSARKYSSVYTLLVFGVIYFIFIFVMAVSVYFLKKTSKLPNALVYGISLFLSTFFMIVPPICTNLIGEVISRIIIGDRSFNFPLSGTLIVTFIDLLLVIFSVICFRFFLSVSLIFRPLSLQCVCPSPQVFINTLSIAITFITGLASHLPKIPQVVLSVFSAILYGLGCLTPFMPGTVIDLNLRKALLASFASGTFLQIVMIIFILIEFQATQITLFIILGILALSVLISNFIIKAIIKKNLAELDAIMDDSTHLESYAVKKSASKVISLLCTGMEFAHPITVDWSLFNKSADIWPDDALLWFVYGKFAAIYPEEMNMIAYIIRNIMSHNLKGFMIKQMIQQAYIIQNQRENSLTAELKRHITNLSKKVSQTKTKMRHVWDLVIQGNVSEMDNAVKISYRSVKDTKNEFNHVLMKYPNNRFVARSYSRFLYEIAGDRKTFNEWKDKINLLKNGMLANDDKARLLGLAAFPNLPKISTSSSKSALSVATNIESEIFTNFDEFNEEENQIQDEQIRLLVDKIDNLSIPSLKCATITTLVLILLLAVCLTIGVYAYTDYFIKDLKPPIDLLYHVNLIRMYAFMMPLWVHHLIMENMPRAVGTTMKVMNIPNVSDIKLDAVGGFETTKQQLQFFMRQCSISVEALGEFHNYYPDDVLLKPIRTILFDPVIEHHYYQNQYSYTPKNMSLSDIVTDNIVLLGAFLNQENSSPTFWFTGMNQPNTLNSFMSAHLLNNNISQVLDLMDIYMEDLTVYTALLLTYVEIGISIAMGIIWIITAIISINWIEKDKIIIYKSLMSLPKNVVSSASESLRILKKSDEESGTKSEVDSEFSKQEDAMLKLFNTATDSSSTKSLDKILFIIIYIIVMGGTIGVGMLLCSLLPNICETINANSAHISNIMGISSYMMGAEISLNDGVISTFGYGPYAPKYTGIGGRNTSLLFNMTEEQLQQLVNSYNFVKFGSEDAYSKPYPQFFETIDQANANFACEDKNAKLTTIRESLDCLSYDSQIIQFSNMVRRYIEPYKIFTSQVVYDPQETMLDEIWRLGIKLYSTTISPMFENVVQTMTSAMKSDANKAIPFIVILIVVCFIAFFVMLFVTSSIRTHLKFALKYVLHCNVTAVTSTAKIMEVLSGEFRPISKDNAMRNKLYYDSVMKELPDNIIVADQNFKVIEFNKAFERMLSSTIQEGDDLRTFFKSDEFIDKDFQLTNNQEKVLQYIKKDGDGIVLHLLTKCVVVSQSYVVTLRDITQIVMYNNLIKEERNKSDKLLASILPPNLVTRVQNGEKNISFAVQSATILFMDIVEFTPWCASGTAAGVMSTLNLMYRYFDSNLSKGKTLTKIKCIGDCYMAAGGIFCEINQPAVHAKEAVEFGLSSIDSIRQLNAEKNENLKIRVGVNTGGPIVAGVLGTEKPTFEILGPAINMAQQMEHNGVPMQVHVSRPVYELIYGGTIRIKERGQIQIKNGKVVTYLVEGREEA